MADFEEAALKLLREVPNYRQCRFLELSCGDGRIIDALRREGASVQGTTFRSMEDDYIRSRPYPEGLLVKGGVDLNNPLPYADGQFDVVFSTEVLEHVEGHRNFIRESARVLRCGGWMVMTTPNLHRLLSRIHFALTGVHLTKERALPYSLPLQRMEEFHHHCADFPIVHWLMWQSGLRIERIIREHVHPLSKLLLLLAPFSRMLTRRALLRYSRADK